MITVLDRALRTTDPVQVCLYEKQPRRGLEIKVPGDASYIFTLSVGLEGALKSEF